MNILQNIPLNPQIREALENERGYNQQQVQVNSPPPIFRGISGWLLALVELFVCFFLSLSPSWNLDSYIRLVYHAMFKTTILNRIKARDEELAVNAPLAPADILAEAVQTSTEPAVGLPNEKELSPDAAPEDNKAPQDILDDQNEDIQPDKPDNKPEVASPQQQTLGEADQPVIAEVQTGFNWN